MTTTTRPIARRRGKRRIAVGTDQAGRLLFPYEANLVELDRYLMAKGCIGPDLWALPGARAPKVAEFKQDLASDGQTTMYAVLDRIRRQHEREGLGSAVRHFFRQRYGLEMHYGGNRKREAVEQ